MVSGYYGRPDHRSQYNPQGAMTAFVSGDTVATNSYLGRYHPVQESDELDVPAEDNFEAPGLTESSGGEATQEVLPPSNSKPKRIPKRKPKKPVQEEDEDEEEDEGSWPFALGRKGTSYNAFFPIMFGGYRGNKGRDSDTGYPGSATAIANSFSTGRGGVASSHATAYGDPYVSTLQRNGYNFKQKPSTQKDDY